MFIASIYSIQDKKNNIIFISNDELTAIEALMEKSSELSTSTEKKYKVNIIDKHIIHVYQTEDYYFSSASKLAFILQIQQYNGEIVEVENVE